MNADIKGPVMNQQFWNRIRRAEGAADPGECVRARIHPLGTVERTVIKLGTVERF